MGAASTHPAKLHLELQTELAGNKDFVPRFNAPQEEVNRMMAVILKLVTEDLCSYQLTQADDQELFEVQEAEMQRRQDFASFLCEVKEVPSRWCWLPWWG
ncbi:unnamed protein product [Effrenium voratum]|uniref:Uncharacterized protein n=1 Tax=Effrenium voratum TaxID=2562239 RepID=A0AA36I180_9DINO|nr:unnamed protein product [Effrenium voratum]